MILSPSPAALAALLGAWRAGITVASLPYPGRAMTPADYRKQIETMAGLVGADLLLIDDMHVPLVPDTILEVRGFGSCFAGSSRGADQAPGQFVQFTSGSTSRPKGVRLTLDAIAANILAILDLAAVGPSDVAFSWLPLSHDMGLMGLCLSALVAFAPERGKLEKLYLLPHDAFLRQPHVWLDGCSEVGATITGGPNFALDLAVRRPSSGRSWDLHRMRFCLVGAEPVRAKTLRRFARATRHHGWSEVAFSPAYGLAEATLAVSIVAPDARWGFRRVDSEALAAGRWQEVDGYDGTEVVSTGRPLAGVDVRIAREPGETVGEVQVASPSLLSGYVGATLTLEEGRWLATKDVGCLIDRELYLVGRLDDLIVVRGRNLYAWELERFVTEHPAVRRGCCVAVPDGQGGYAIVAEPARTADARRLPDALTWIKRRLVGRFGVAPSAVVFVRAGTLPKTPSGKAQRRRVEAAFGRRLLQVEVERAFAR